MDRFTARLRELQERSAATDRQAAEALADLQAAGAELLAAHDRLEALVAAEPELED